MRIVRRLFLVLLADNDHGKTSIIRALVSQGLGRSFERQKKGVRWMVSPWGRSIESYIFGRSYQEVEKRDHGSVERALDANDPDWRKRELVIMPSHVADIDNGTDHDDIDQIIDAAHGAGFDVICASVIFTGGNADVRTQFAGVWKKPWDERWTIPNPRKPEPEGQLDALGRDLWTWICRALAS